MRKAIYFILATLSLYSCLGNDDDKVTYYGDAAITSFSLGTLKRTVHTTTKAGADSTYTVDYNAGAVKFCIDQVKHEIYNLDSLPTGVDTLHVICNIGTKNGGLPLIRSEVGDTLKYFNSTDSVSFAVNPRRFAVASSDGTSVVDYTVKLNTHKEEALKMSWGTAYVDDDIKGAASVRLFEWRGRVWAATGTALAALGTTGTALAAPGTTGTALAAQGNIAVVGDVLYATDNDGDGCCSADGVKWTKVWKGAKIYGASAGKIYALKGGKLVALTPVDNIEALEGIENIENVENVEGVNGTGSVEAFYPGDEAKLPVWEKGPSLCEVFLKGTTDGCGTVIAGADKDGVNRCLYKGETTAEEHLWMSLENEYGLMLPAGTVRVVSYAKQYLLALTGNKIYTSQDYGRTWRQWYRIYGPAGLDCGEVFDFLADSRGNLWIACGNGAVFCGKLNAAGW